MAVLRLCVVAGAGLLVLAGCYTYEPARTTPQPGRELAFDINDTGRVALRGAMGPEVSQIEGRLIQKTDTAYLMSVSVVHLLRGGEQTWSGEEVRLPQAFVSAMYEKRFSKSRTLIAGATTAAVVVLVATKSSLLGLGGLDPAKTPPDTFLSVRRPR